MEDLIKNRYSDEELEEFRGIINKKLNKVLEQIKFLRGQIDDISNSADGRIKGLDDGVGTAESERVMQMLARANKHKKHLENAIVRIDNKAYGVCRVTGKLISKERLKAVPHATLSIEAKQMKAKK